MNRKKRKSLLSLFLVLILMLTTACATSTTDSDQKAFSQAPKEAGQEKDSGKDKKDAEVKALSEVNEIPEDGIIRKEQFETVAGQDMQVSFVGQTDDGYRYTWTYDASKIQNPQDQNLLIDFNKDDLDDVKMSANNANDALEMTMHGKGLICPPTLTVEVPEAWQSDACLLLKEQNGELARMSDVTIQSSPKEEPEGSAGGSGKESDKETSEESAGDKKSGSKKNNADSSDKGQSGDDSQAADLESLTAPVPGTTTLIMTVTSIDGICYIVGGITNEGKISQINDIAKASENANAAAGSDENAGSGGSGGTGTGTGSGSGSGTTQRGINGSGSKGSSSKGSGSKSGNSGSGSGSSGSGSSGSNKTYTCTISISCSTILNNMDNLTDGKEEFVPGNGWILKKTKVKFSQGDSVHDVLQKICRDKGIHMESRYTPAYNSAYVEGINQLYEFDCGELSGWMYNVNGWFPNYGCSKYKVSDGDVINWVYTCDLGKDVGDNSMY